jgi:YidC/Oxa1 family membrane protein insertase
MEKRLIVAVLLSIGVLYAYSYLFPAPKPLTAPGSQAKQVAPVTAAQPAQQGSPAAVAPSAAPVAGCPQATAPARDVTVDTELYTAVFSSQGAGLKKLVLKKYKETAGPQGKDIVLLDESVPNRFALLNDSREFGLLPTATYNVTGDNLKLAAGSKGTLEFTTVTPQGVEVK